MFRSDDSHTGFSADRVQRNISHPAAQVRRSPPRTFSTLERAVKRGFDIIGALAFFVLFAPFFLLIAFGVGLTSGWPVHYRQTRMGRDGRRFHFYKFRSMVRDSDRALADLLQRDQRARAEWDAFQHLRNDPRITPIGRHLRKFSLDELPQFWNVLKGDMSLVGPRPCMERQASLYGGAWAHYCAVRPGITGLWQVSGRNDLTFAQRVELDVGYVDSWSMWKDCVILFRTLRAVTAGD